MCTKLNMYMKNARQSIEKGEYHRFIEDITQALYLSENDEKVLMLYVHGLMEFEDFEKALEVIDELLKNFDTSELDREEMLQNKVSILCTMAEYEAAELVCEELCRSSMINTQIKGYAGLSSLYLNQYVYRGLVDYELLHKVVDSCNKALELLDAVDSKKIHQDVLLNLGTVYWHKKDYVEALKAFKEVFVLSGGKNSQAIISIAEVYMDLGQYQQAGKFIKKAVDLKVSDPYILAGVYLAEAKFHFRCHYDLSEAREHVMIAYDNFVQADALLEAGYCSQLIQYLDYIINTESIGFLISKAGSRVRDVLGLHKVMEWIKPWSEWDEFCIAGFNVGLPVF